MVNIKRISIPFLAFLQTTGFVAYLVLLSLFFQKVIPNLNKSAEFFAPIIMLLLFVISAIISASLMLGRAAVLFWNKNFKAAFTLIGWSVGWGLLYFLILISLLSIK